MKTTGRTSIWLMGGAIGLTLLIIYGLNSVLPFNLKYVKQVKSQLLRDNVKEWDIQSKPEFYGRTNQTDASYMWRTNLIVGDSTVMIVMRLDSFLFREKGYLVATTNREVFWVDRNGGVQPMKSKISTLTNVATTPRNQTPAHKRAPRMTSCSRS